MVGLGSHPGPLLPRRRVLTHGEVTVRLLRRRDERAWLMLRAANREWLRPWEAMPPDGPPPAVSFGQYVRREWAAVRSRAALPLVIEVDGALVGRVSLYRVEWGAEAGGSLGYWVARDAAGRGIAPAAVALVADHAFRQGLHRLEIGMRPENEASVRVAQKLGFREEGLRRGYLYIDGAWRDHRIFALTSGEAREGEYWPPRVDAGAP